MIKKGDGFITFVSYYLPIFLWMGLIFYLSSIPGLRSGSSSIPVELFLRKSAHMTEYFILTFLIWRVFYFRFKFSLPKSGILAICFCFLYALSDELHQFFINDRAGRLLDVFIDLVGGTLGFLFGILISKIKIRK